MDNQTLDTKQTLNYRKQIGIIAIIGLVFKISVAVLKSQYPNALLSILTNQNHISFSFVDAFHYLLSFDYLLFTLPYILIIVYVFALYKKRKLNVFIPITFLSILIPNTIFFVNYLSSSVQSLLFAGIIVAANNVVTSPNFTVTTDNIVTSPNVTTTEPIILSPSTNDVFVTDIQIESITNTNQLEPFLEVFIIIAMILATISAFGGFQKKTLLYVSLGICGLVSGYSLITNLVGVYQSRDFWIAQVYLYLPKILSTVSLSLLYVALFTLGLKNKFPPIASSNSTNAAPMQQNPVQPNIEQVFVDPLTGRQYGNQPYPPQQYGNQQFNSQPYNTQPINVKKEDNQFFNGQQCTGQVFDISQFDSENSKKTPNTDTSDAE